MSLLTVLFTFPHHLDLVIRSQKTLSTIGISKQVTGNKEISKAFLRVSGRVELSRVRSSYRGLNYRKMYEGNPGEIVFGSSLIPRGSRFEVRVREGSIYRVKQKTHAVATCSAATAKNVTAQH